VKKINKFLSITLILTLLISAFSFVGIVDYTAKAASINLPKIDFDNVSSDMWHSNGFFGIGANKTNWYENTTYLYGSSKQSAKFISSGTSSLDTVRFSFTDEGIGTDWSYGDTIVLPIYNAKQGTDSVNLVFYTSASTAGYYYKPLRLDWSGWKLVKIPKSSFGKKGGDENWANINGFYINSNGWGTDAIAESIEIYVDSVYLTSNKSTGETYVDFKDTVLTDAMGLTSANASGSDTFYSAKFTASGSAVTTAALPLDDYCVSSDWTSARALALDVYNVNANGQVVNVVFNKTADTSTTAGYTVASFALNHTGWKTIEIPGVNFENGGSAPGLGDLKGLYLSVGGFGSTSVQSNVEFYLASIELKTSGSFVAEAIADSVAVYANSTKALNELASVTLSNPPVYKNDTLYAPLSLFENLFGGVADEYTLTMNQMTLSFEDGDDIVVIGEYKHKLSENAYLYNSEIYVPLSDMCELFDIPLHQRGRLAVMGSESDIDFITYFNEFGVNEVDEQIASKLDKVNSADYTDADCEAVIENKLRTLVGNEALNDLSNSAVASKISSVTSAAKSARNLLDKTEGAAELFTDQTTTTTAHMTTTADRIKNMALAYGTYGSELYRDESLLEDILYSLEWFYQNRYGEDEINGTGWRSTSAYNWHDWKIGTPYAIMYTMMIVRDSLSSEQISNYLKCFHHVSPTTYSSGANYMDACELIICAAALEKDPERINEYKEKAEGNFMYVENARHLESQLDAERQSYTPNKGHGFYTDGSYLYHTLHAMNGSYGIKHLTSAASIIRLFEDTKFEISKQCIDNLADWLVNSFDGATYGTRMFRMFLGRGENPSETGSSNSIVSIGTKCFDLFDEEDKIRVGSIIKYYAGSNPSKYNGSVDVEYLDTYNEIVASDEYDQYRYDFANVFGNIDKVVQRRSDWGMGISMSSSRIFNYESINGLNKNGWYLGDGRTELILKDEANSSASNYWKNINYYRLPGTTVDTQKRQLATVAQGNEYLSSKDFVGGKELDGKYSTAAMHLESYHNDTDFGKDGGEYGGKNPAHTSDLTAKKSYFMFDNEIYCLGAEINASNNNGAEVLTVVDNRIANYRGSSRLKVPSSSSNKESNEFAFAKFGIGSNWSKVSKIRVPVYSSANNGQKVNVIFNKASTDILSGYYYTTFTVNWTGWKVVELTPSSFTPSRGIKNWSDINSMYFNYGGWSGNCLADTDLYYADLEALDASGNVLYTIPFTSKALATAGGFDFSTSVLYDGVQAGNLVKTNNGNITAPIGSEISLSGTEWMNVDEKLGYLFFDEFSNGALKVGMTSGAYLESYLSHGTNPSNGTYAYALLPNMTSAQTISYAQAPDVEILSNTGDVQAVRYNKENITSIVFWNAGTFGGITVSDPMMVMVKDNGENLTLAVSDPTHKLDEAYITIERALLVSYADSCIAQISSGDSLTLEIDFSETLGSSLEAKLKAAEPVTSVVFKNASGKKIVQYVSQSEGSVTADITVSNLSGDDYKCNIYAAVYSTAEELESVQTVPATVSANGGKFSTQVTITPTTNTKRIEIYVWDETGNKPCATLYRN